LTGWPEGDAVKAAVIGFKAWRSLRGGGNDERRKILEQVSDFVERHGDGRFSSADASGPCGLRDRAGWWCDTQVGRLYLFTAEGMRDALKGFDFKRALDELEACGVIPKPGEDGRRGRPERIGGRIARVYEVRADALRGCENMRP
jgi:putative DNA primase/helicase